MLILKRIASGAASGVLIGIGGTVYLASGKTWLSAIMFSVALLCICYKGYSLFTGKVGYLVHSHTKKDLSVLFCGLLGNFIGAAATAVFVMFGFGMKPIANAESTAMAKLEQLPYETLIRAFMCGILMYMAVSIFKSKNSTVGILFCIPTFILCGFEHSIADIYYLAAGMTWSTSYALESLLFILMAIIGNALGAIFIALFDKTKETPDEQR